MRKEKKRTSSEEMKIWKPSKMELRPIQKEKAPMSVVLQEKCSDKEESLSSLSKAGKKRSLGGGCGMTEWTESTNEKHTAAAAGGK